MAQPEVILYNLYNIFVWIPLLILVVPAAVIFGAYKLLLEKLVIRTFKPNFHPLTGIADTLVCQGDSYSFPNTNCAQVWLLSGTWITAKEFSSHFKKCFLDESVEKYSHLFANVVTYGGYSFFAHCEPEDLDLEWHIKEYSITDYSLDGSLESFVVNWMTTNTYERYRPIWQIAIIHLKSPDCGATKTAIVAKFSHSLLDGYSFIHMIGKLTDSPVPYMVPNRIFTWIDKIKYIFQTPVEILHLHLKMTFSTDSQSPFKGAALYRANHKQKWLMSFATVNLSAVKAIRRSTDTHFICLMMSAQVGVLRRLMLETMKDSELPEFLWIGSSLPWPNHPFTLTNHWTAGAFKCPLRLDDPLKRLKWMEAEYRKFKRLECDIKGTLLFTTVFNLLPTIVRRTFLRYDLAVNNVPLYFSDLMLSSKTHYLLGRKVEKLYLPLSHFEYMRFALYGISTSHGKQLDLSISVCYDVVKDQNGMNRLTQIYFIEELEHIAAQCNLSCNLNTIDKE